MVCISRGVRSDFKLIASLIHWITIDQVRSLTQWFHTVEASGLSLRLFGSRVGSASASDIQWIKGVVSSREPCADGPLPTARSPSPGAALLIALI